MVPLFAGVIIAGLGIGALLSAWAARHAPVPQRSHAPVVVVHTPTPVAARIAQATLQPKPARSSSPAPESPPPKPTPSAEPASPPPTTTEAPAKSPVPTSSPRATPAAIATPAHKPSPAETAKRVAQQPSPPPAAPAAQTDNSPAGSLVLHYLQAVANGDDASARSALAASGDTTGDVQYLDPSYRVTSVSTSRNGSGDTDVQVEFRTARGQYFGTFRVDPSGKKILLHEIIPVGGTTAR